MHICGTRGRWVNTLRPRLNGLLFADHTFKRSFLNENIIISIKISLKFVPKGLINNIPALVLIMAWRRTGDKPLSEPMLVRSLTHICVTRPQWVNTFSTDTVGCCYAMINWSGIILGMGSASERCYYVTSPLIGWVHTQNDPWMISQASLESDSI